MATTDTTTTSPGFAFGAALAQPTIAFIQSQIGASLPSQVASFITSQFATASNPAGSPAQPSTAAAALQSLAPDAGVADFFSALNAKLV